MPSSKRIFTPQKKSRIIYHFINAILAAALIFLGAISDGEITHKTFCYAGLASLSVLVINFKDFWAEEESRYCGKKGQLGFFIMVR